jgi:long-subunit fatty acid transport protein
LYIDETFNTELTTTFDNGIQFTDDAPGRFSYNIVRPQRFKAGATVEPVGGVSLTASAEKINYSDAKIEFDELSLNTLETDINTTVRSSFNDVINLRGGLEYKANERFTPRIGYGYYPSPQDGIDSDRQFINGGFSAELTKGLMFDFGLQYSFWDDENVLYSTSTTSEVVQEEVTRLHVMAGIRMTL